MATFNNKDVSGVVLGADDIQPAGATGDNRLIVICFSDGSTPVNKTILSLKKYSTALGNQIISITNQKDQIDSVVDLTTSL